MSSKLLCNLAQYKTCEEIGIWAVILMSVCYACSMPATIPGCL